MCAQQGKQPQRQAAQRKNKTGIGIGLIRSEQEPYSQPVPIPPSDDWQTLPGQIPGIH